jgi:hypothetical protein
MSNCYSEQLKWRDMYSGMEKERMRECAEIAIKIM